MTVLRKQCGFSLLSALVSIAISSMALTYSLGVITNSLNGMRSVSSVGDIEDLRKTLMLSLSNLQNCQASFAGKQIPKDETLLATKLVNNLLLQTSNGVPIATVGMRLGGRQTLSALDLGDFKTLSTDADGTKRYLASVTATTINPGGLSRARKVSVGIQAIPLSPLLMQVTGCFDPSSSTTNSNSGKSMRCPSGYAVTSVNFGTESATCSKVETNSTTTTNPLPTPSPSATPDSPANCTLVVKSKTANSITLTLTLLGKVDFADVDGANVTLPAAPSTSVDIVKSTNGAQGQSVAIVRNTTGDQGTCSVSYSTCKPDQIVSIVLDAKTKIVAPQTLISPLTAGQTVTVENVSGTYKQGSGPFAPTYNCNSSNIPFGGRPILVMKDHLNIRLSAEQLYHYSEVIPQGATALYGYFEDAISFDNQGECKFDLRIHEDCR